MTEKFGKYRLDRKLAVGGMAEIFLATQQGPEGFTKHVAIKRILPHLVEDEDFITMFLDEARLVARFNHPNIVQIYELGEEDGRYFLAMEFVHGVSMSRLLKVSHKQGTPLPLEYGAKIISFACEGLEYAHCFTDGDGTPLNLIHRDVSPQNLMLSYDGVVKVLDFGIAKAAGNIYQTRTSSLKGKAAYMSPEQISQKIGLDYRSDIFSLGIVLFEFATGRRPFSGDAELELMMSIVQKKAPDPRQFDETVPEDMVRILDRALQKDRDRRYQSCRELRQDLEEFLINRRLLVDKYTLGGFARELIPPSDTGVGYAVPTPSRPALADAGSPALTTPLSPARTPTGRRQPPSPRSPEDDAPTQVTPSGTLRPLVVDEPHRVGAGRRIFLGLLVLVLVGAIGASAAYFLFGNGDTRDSGHGRDAGVDLAGPVSAPGPDAGVESVKAPAPDAGVAETTDGPARAVPVVREGDPEVAAPAPRPKKKKKRRRRRIDKKPAPQPARTEKPDAGVQVAKVQKPGKLVVNTRPWTNVAIDGTSYGTTPVGPVELKPGEHRIEMTNKAKGIRITRSVHIAPGKTQRVVEKFGRGLLNVFVKPFGEVFVNGISKGITPLGGPVKLYEGKHTVKVICSRTGKKETKKVRIRAGKTVKLIFDLR